MEAKVIKDMYFQLNKKKILSDANIGKRHSDESYLRAANSKRGQKHSKETVEKMRERMIGNTYCAGIKLTEERKQKLREINLGRKHTAETLLKISKSKTGKIMDEETKNKISISKTGIRHSEETKVKMSNSQKNRDNNTGNPTLDEDKVIYIRKELSITDKEFAIKYGVSMKTIKRIRNGETWKKLLIAS